MILLVDCFDSFTFNLQDLVKQVYDECEVVRINEIKSERFQKDIKGIILSPGPGIPEHYPMLREILRNYEHQASILGVCLGMQAIGTHFGCQLVKSGYPMHGKNSDISHSEHTMFSGIPKSFSATRYHSLCLKDVSAPLIITAQTNSQTAMAISHQEKPIWGVQYHPEAILTDHGSLLIKNWTQTFK